MNDDCTSCQKILEIINDLIDGELEGEKLKEAERLIAENPQCQTMFNSVNHTIKLYRMRRKEVDEMPVPTFDWDKLKAAADED